MEDWDDPGIAGGGRGQQIRDIGGSMAEEQQGRYVEATKTGVEDLIKRLDLSRFVEAGLKIEKAEVIGERIRLSLNWEDVGSETVVLRRADEDPAFVSTRRISFSTGGSSVTRPWMILLNRMALSAGDADIDDLVFTVAGGVPQQTADLADSPINSWNVDTAWCQFMCDHAMERKFYEAFQFEDNASFLVHGDLECKFITPRFRATLPRFFNYAWKIYGESESGDPITDLKDEDVIHGGEERLHDSIEDLLAARRRPGPVIINSTCVPVVIDDDVEKVISRFKTRCFEGIYHISPRTEDPMEIMMKYLDDARERALAASGPVPGSVALIGFRSGRTHREIMGLVGDCNIPITGTILPSASARLMEEVMRADVLVFRPSVFHTELYDRVFRGCGRSGIYPDPPWGFKGTAKWLREIGAATGREQECAKAFERRMAPVAAEMAELRNRAADHEMTFVADPANPSRLLDPTSSTGLDVLPAVAELGYRVRVLSIADREAVFRDFRDRMLSWAESAGFDIAVDPFTDEGSLADAIRQGQGGAVFSEYFYDHRISREGRPQFSARDFEMGFEGAVRTARRLNRITNLKYYARYGRLAIGGSQDWWKP